MESSENKPTASNLGEGFDQTGTLVADIWELERKPILLFSRTPKTMTMVRWNMISKTELLCV